MGIRGSAIILLFSVLLLFLVPAGAGSFSAVNGPVTALRANRAAQFFFAVLTFGAGAPQSLLSSLPASSKWHFVGDSYLTGSISFILPALRC